MTDIVVATRDRRDLLMRTIVALTCRTRPPYRMTIIDDGSDPEVPSYLIPWTVIRHEVPLGIAANLRQLLAVTKSDPLVYTDDDVLCPYLEPDWLSQMLAEMEARPHLGILGLNNPQAHPSINGDSRRIAERDGEVTYCRNVGGQFVMFRRQVLEELSIGDGLQSPLKQLCIDAGSRTWRVGFMTNAYCQHIGEQSVRGGYDWSKELDRVRPVDDRTLEPPVEYRS